MGGRRLMSMKAPWARICASRRHFWRKRPECSTMVYGTSKIACLMIRFEPSFRARPYYCQPKPTLIANLARVTGPKGLRERSYNVRMFRLLILTTMSLLTVLAFGQSKDAFKDTAQTHWVIRDLEQFSKDGLLAGYPTVMARRNHPWSSRFEIAAAVSTSYSNLKDWAEGVGEGAKQVASMKPGKHSEEYRAAITEELRELKRKVPVWQPEFLRLIKAFDRELRTLGLDTSDMTKQVKASCALVARCQIRRAKAPLS